MSLTTICSTPFSRDSASESEGKACNHALGGFTHDAYSCKLIGLPRWILAVFRLKVSLAPIEYKLEIDGNRAFLGLIASALPSRADRRNTMEKFDCIVEIVEAAKADVAKFESGNKTAGTRVRKTMLQIKNLAHEIRKDISAMKTGS